MGRSAVTIGDAMGKIIQRQVPGLAGSYYQYDAKGRLSDVRQGTGEDARNLHLVYNEQGYVQRIENALEQSVHFSYDDSGRVTGQTLADGREIIYSYDDNGNILAITPPGKPAHNFKYTLRDQTASYKPPVIGLEVEQTFYSYNYDKQLTKIVRPDAKQIDLFYDGAGRLTSLQSPRGVTDYAYNLSSGKLDTIITADNNALGYQYDGPLLTSTQWAGEINGEVSRSYDNDFRITSRSINGGSSINFGFDSDGLLTSAGSLSIARDPQNGLVTSTSLGQVTTSRSYNHFGELETYAALYDGASIFSQHFSRDKLGRIIEKTEKKEGVTTTFSYSYDLAGRLTEVLKDGLAEEYYEYDLNGNRTLATVRGETTTATYDAQDRLLDYGNLSFSYTPNGELLSKADNTDPENPKITTYDYDVFGNLRAVYLPSGEVVEYVIDGRNRRIGQKLNGILQKGWLYKDQLNPVAEVDATNQITKRFSYATKVNVPEYMQQGTTTYRVVSDYLGSPRMLVDMATGEVLQTMDFDAWGNVLDDTAPGAQPFGFAGGLYEQSTGLVRFGARDYDAGVGRWTGKDSSLFLGDQSNFYLYANGDSVNIVDISGKSWADVELIVSVFNILVNEMTISGYRFNLPGALSGYITNLYFWFDYLNEKLTGDPVETSACGDQWSYVADFLDELQKRGAFDDHWRFVEETQGGGAHRWGNAISDNINDPIVFLDPWKNKYYYE